MERNKGGGEFISKKRMTFQRGTERQRDRGTERRKEKEKDGWKQKIREI